MGRTIVLKTFSRIESFTTLLGGFKCGYALWLTNDKYYWKAPTDLNAGYAAFSIHQGAKKTGSMSWGTHLSPGTIKGREKELRLLGEYDVNWNDYSDLDTESSVFKYALIHVGNCISESVYTT